jgi:hypothetical protein
MYRCKNGEIEQKLFTSNKPPKGWHDHHKKAKAAYNAPKKKIEEKPQEKIAEETTIDLLSDFNDNSTRDHQPLS